MNDWSFIRSDALLDPEIQKSPAVYMTLAAISTFTTRSKDGYCYFKQETVAKNLGKSRQAISRDLKKLAELGYLEIISQTYRGFKSNNAYRIKYQGALTHDATPRCDDATPRCDDATPRCTTTQHDVAAKCFTINAKKEKEALTRNDFFKLVEEEWKNGSFDKIAPLSNDDLYQQTEKCWLNWEANNDFPKGSYLARFKGWLYTGVEKGIIGKKSKDQACLAEESKDLPNWQKAALEEELFTREVFKSWIRPTEWNGNGTLYAPTRFSKDYLENHYMPQLRKALHPQIKIEVKENATNA